ncbi:MAG: formate C-acetyltransferase [Clostridium sp.]|nr:formate C-acetyltransferase [Clostridium sp.]
MFKNAWKGFASGIWQKDIDVRNFIVRNYKPYGHGEEFLACPSTKTQELWKKCRNLLREEYLKSGVLDIDTHTISGITSYTPGYIDKKHEIIKGLQTDSPLKRAINAYGGIRMVKQACKKYGYALSQEIDRIFTKYRRTHNDGVYSCYTPEMRRARKCGVITGLPDAYGRGRIVGDYRRVALYGVGRLIKDKKEDLKRLEASCFSEEVTRLHEEVFSQIEALEELVVMAKGYGFDIAAPARNSFEAVQWTYFAFLGAMKETNGAANSLGRVSNFFDIYIERDLSEGKISEAQAQELIDQFVIKLRLIRHLRTPEYNELFAGDPVWITEAIGGMCDDGRHMITKTSYRFLQTLFNLGSAPEPNITILWSEKLPLPFKKFCAKVSMLTSSIQYENDVLMTPLFGDDYSISCCVSAMRTGKEMQFFGARCNLPKLLLLALNGGRDEITGAQIAPKFRPFEGEYLEYQKVLMMFKNMQGWLAQLYVNTMNIIHYMHDKYAYERLMMALHDTELKRNMAFGVAGLSVLADSLSAVKYAKVRPIRDERNLIVDFRITGEYPQFGNDDDRVDDIAAEIVRNFYKELKKYSTYRDSKHTLSILTITSNVMYGKKTGSTPDGRKMGDPFAPGCNPMHGRDKNGVLAVLNSVSKIPYSYCMDGISLTLSMIPNSLGGNLISRTDNLVALLDGYFAQNGHHININVLEKELLEKAMQEPDNYPQLTIRVSGYAVNFVKLTREQQLEVISRTFHSSM